MNCCCNWGVAIGKRRGVPSGEWPEFPCRDCEVHLDEDNESRRCKRHKYEPIMTVLTDWGQRCPRCKGFVATVGSVACPWGCKKEKE